LCYFIILQQMSTPSTPASGSLTREALRSEHNLRPLAPEEEGVALEKQMPGVYGFTYAPDQPAPPLFSRHSYHSFEMHKDADGTGYLVGFVTPNEASQVGRAESGARIRMFPDPFGDSQTLIRVQVRAFVPPKRMPREDGNPMPFTLV
jgi:hypothetical protein